MGTLLEVFHRQVALGGDRAALRTRAGGLWIATSWREWEDTAVTLAAALIDLGVSPGDRVAVLSHTRREWAEADLGILHAGGVTVPIYPDATHDGVAHAIMDSGASVVIADDPLQIEKLFDPKHAPATLRRVRRVVYMDTHRRLDSPDVRGRLHVRLDDVVPLRESSRLMAYTDLLAAGRRLLVRKGESFVRARVSAVTTGTVATVVYTSGTEGHSRGVVLTHGNLTATVAHVIHRLGVTSADEQLLFLPLAHIVGRSLLIGAIQSGCVTSFAESTSQVMNNIAEVHPTFLGASPVFFELLRDRIERRMAAEPPARRRASSWALGVGRRVGELRLRGQSPGVILSAEHRIASVTMLDGIRRLLGRRIRFAVVGGSALSAELGAWFNACGVLLIEGYGLTETAGVTHLNAPGDVRFGTVGRPVEGVGVQLGDDGEVLVRGESVMMGYLDAPDETALALGADGWLHTGDTGTVDTDGRLRITGRIADVVLLADGVSVAPQPIEAALRRSSWISQAIVVGEGRPYLTALLVLAEEPARTWARSSGLDLPWSDLCAHTAVRQRLDEVIAGVNEGLPPHARVKRYEVLDKPWTVEGGGLTPTQKLRRAAVTQRYAVEIAGIYNR